MLERGKKRGKKKQKRVHRLESIIKMASQHPCVYNNDNLIISSVASKQQSDTVLHKQEHGALLELLANEHS